MARQPRDRLRLEEIASVLDCRVHGSVRPFADEQREVERRRDRDEHDVVAGGGVQQDEADLEYRVLAEGPLGLQLLDELLERHVRVGVGAQASLAHSSQKHPEGRVVGQVGAKGQRVDEQPDERLELDVVPVRHRRAHGDVVLAAGAREEHLEHREQGHEQGGALTATERPEALGQRGRHDEIVAGSR